MSAGCGCGPKAKQHDHAHPEAVYEPMVGAVVSGAKAAVKLGPVAYQGAKLAGKVMGKAMCTPAGRKALEEAVRWTCSDRAGTPPKADVEMLMAISPDTLAPLQSRVQRLAMLDRTQATAAGTCHTCTDRDYDKAIRVFERMSSGEQDLEQQVSADVMWSMMSDKLYMDHADPTPLAVRELLQNSVDAIRAAMNPNPRKNQGFPIAEGSGRLEIIWRQEADGTYTLIADDNGIGMSPEIIQKKFLVLGATGKGYNADDEEGGGPSNAPAGGFGVAKAIILGLSRDRRWVVHTRDNLLYPSSGSGLGVKLKKTEMRQGTRIEIRGLANKYERSKQSGITQSTEDSIAYVLRASYTDDVDLFYNGKRVSPWFNPKSGTQVRGYKEAWGEGITCAIRKYRRDPSTGNGGIFVRIGGLWQFTRSFYLPVPWNVTLDFTISPRIRPTDADTSYPFTANRDAFNPRGQASDTFSEFQEAFIADNQGAPPKSIQEYQVLLPDAESGVFDAGDPESDAELQSLFRDAVKDAATYAKGMIENDFAAGTRKQEAVDPEEIDASGPRGKQAIDIYDGFMNTSAVLAEAGQALESGTPEEKIEATKIVGNAILKVLEVGHNYDSKVRFAVADLRAGENLVSAEDVRALGDALVDASRDASVAEAFGGAVGAATLVQQIAGMLPGVSESNAALAAPAVQEVVKRASNPFGRLGALVVHHKYDKQRARNFRQAKKKWFPYMLLWDMTIRLISKAGGLTKQIIPGFCLDDSVRGLETSQYDHNDRPVHIVMINPDFMYTLVKSQRDTNTAAIAGALHTIACHEISHVPNHGSAHGDEFITFREDLSFKTANTIALIEAALVRIFKIDNPPMTPVAAQQVQRAKEATQAKADRKLAKLVEARTELEKKVSELAREAKKAEKVRARLEEQIKSSTFSGSMEAERLRELVVRLSRLEDYFAFRRWLQTPAAAATLPDGVKVSDVLALVEKSPEDFSRFLGKLISR